MTGIAREIESRVDAPLRAVRLGKSAPVVEHRADGVICIRAAQDLGRYHDTLGQPLKHWAKTAPERIFLAQRDAQGHWRKLTYAQVLFNVERIGAALLRRGLSAERPIVVLSGNDIEHALLGLAAMYVGIPYAPISPPYSLMSSDFGKLRVPNEAVTTPSRARPRTIRSRLQISGRGPTLPLASWKGSIAPDARRKTS